MLRRTAPSPASAVALSVALALAAVACLASPAVAFDSLPGGPHDDVTAAAVRESGFPDEAVDALVAAVRAVDLRDHALEPTADDVGRIDAAGDYRPERHCERVPPTGDAEAFNATVAYVANRSEAAVAAAQAGEASAAVRLLGEMLHALQDCFSHSNAVDLEDPEGVVGAVNGEAAAPAGLRLTGFQPGADDPESPEGDPYPHGEFAKDSADKNDESRSELADGVTKFEAARALAVQASIVALQKVLAQLDADQLEALAMADVGGPPVPRVGVPSLGWTALLVAAILAALRRRAA